MSSRTRYCRPEARASFREQVPFLGTTEGLVRAAVAVARHERDDADPEKVLSRIESLAAEVRRRATSGSVRSLIAHLHGHLFDELGFRGSEKDYYAPEMSYLPLVLERKRGLPITLSLVYKAVGERAGLKVHGINAPAHFLAAVEEEDGNRMLVDPFLAGRVLSREEALRRVEEIVRAPVPPDADLLQIATPREWLLRILANLKAVFSRRHRIRDVRAMEELQREL